MNNISQNEQLSVKPFVFLGLALLQWQAAYRMMRSIKKGQEIQVFNALALMLLVLPSICISVYLAFPQRSWIKKTTTILNSCMLVSAILFLTESIYLPLSSVKRTGEVRHVWLSYHVVLFAC